MNWFRKFMEGRYGADQLNMVLFILSLLFLYFTKVFNAPPLALAGYAFLAAGVFRMLSRNVSKRSMENYRFTMLTSPLYSWFLTTRNRYRDRKTYKYFKCPKCHANLRVPRGKGKVKVTCVKCRHEFNKKT
ncbi:MAG: hypothetical protein Q8878_10015 [Bacillota bacterium]|nr:hypothetical protein [Bacillota bacterium]